MRPWKVLLITISILLYLFAFVGLHTVYNNPTFKYFNLFDFSLSPGSLFDFCLLILVAAFVLQLVLNLREDVK